MANKNITTVIENSIPQFIRLQYPNFVEFIKLYYADQEQEGSAYEFIANILGYADVDKTTLDFLENFSEQYLSSLPKNILPGINKRTLIKYIREYYQSVGSESSIKFLFRILFNESVDLYYPSTDMLRVSDGKWQKQKIIKTTNSNLDDSIRTIEGSELKGQTSGAVGLVEKVGVYTASNGSEVAEIFLTDFDPLNPISGFQPEENVVANSLDNTKTFSETINYIISDINILNGGMYNSPGDVIEVISTVGADAVIRVKSVEEGSVDGIEILNGGTLYAVDDLIFFEANRESRGAKAKVTSVGFGGDITGVKIIDKGYAYDRMPTYSIDSVDGTGAILYPVSETIGTIKEALIINHGVRYDPNSDNSFPLQFPISFAESYDLGHLEFYRTAFVYDDVWNDIEYNRNEVIFGETSGSRANIVRFDKEAGILVYDPIIDTADFVVGEILQGEVTGARGYKIHKLWSASADILADALGKYEGSFLNRDGFLDSDKYLQDSYYYQDFSYVLTTTKPKDEWFNYLKPNIHPAGTIAFGYGESLEVIRDSVESDLFISPTLESVRFYIDETDRDDTRWTPQIYGDRLLATKPNTQEKDYKFYEDYTIESGSVDQLEVDDDSILVLDDNNDNFLIINDDPIVYNEINTSIKAHLCFGSKIVYDISDENFGLAIDGTNEFLIDNTNFLVT